MDEHEARLMLQLYFAILLTILGVFAVYVCLDVPAWQALAAGIVAFLVFALLQEPGNRLIDRWFGR